MPHADRTLHLSPGYAQDQILFATTYGGGNLWSLDGGASWAAQNTGMQAAYTDGSAISPNFPSDGTAFTGDPRGLQRTSDWGATWQLMRGPGSSAYPRGLDVSPNFAQDSTVYIGINTANLPTRANTTPHSGPAEGLYVSSDAGQTWVLSSLRGKGVVSIAFSPAFAQDQTAFAATMSAGLYITTDGARTWSRVVLPNSSNAVALVAVSPAFATDRLVLAARINGAIYRSADAGATWTEIPNTHNLRALDIRFSPNFAGDQTLFVGTVQSGLMQSVDGGMTLLPVTSFPDVFVMAAAVSPGFQNDHTVFAAGYHGLFKSADGGSSWAYLATPARIEETRHNGSSLGEPPSLTYQGAWSFVTSSSTASTSGYATTSSPQDTVTLNFMGTGVRWISSTGPDQGAASVQLDGSAMGDISLTAADDQYQNDVWELRGLPCQKHVLTITANLQPNQSVSLDAFDIWIDNCQYTTFNAK